MVNDLFRDDNFDTTIIPDKWYYFEVLDRSHILANHLENALFNHPGLDEEYSRKAQQAMSLIREIYQYAGNKCL